MTKNKPGTGKTIAPVKGIFYTKGIKSIGEYVLPEVCHTTHGLTHRTIAADVNLRAGHNRHNYDAQRPSDRLPTEHAKIILACQSVYRKVGMVRNIIDLMTDFAAEGLQLQHTTKTQERFFREWARRVNLQGRAHDFMKLLMRDANVIVRRKNAFITKPAIKEMTKAIVSGIDTIDETKVNDPPEKIKTIRKKTNRQEIPWRYTFLSPVIIEKIGGEVGRFFGSDDLGMRIPTSLSNAIKRPRTDAEKAFIKKLPPEVTRAAKKHGTLVALDMDRIYVDYYKKDDWEDWGTPFLYGVLEDVMFKEKMRLADMAALDGVINVIRLWKLGKSDQQILPAPALVDRLIGILQNNTGGGVMDLVWDDMIDLKVEYPPIDKILGAEKYAGVNADIVRGLGIPDSLVGGQDLGTRNAQSAFVQLKTLVERLEYVRGRAIRWMEGELRLVADAMSFKRIPSISFGIMSLRDEAAEKQLMIQLLDRGIISSEKANEVFGVNYMIELERIKTEQQIRKENPGVLERSNPYNRPFSVMEKQTELAIQVEKVKKGFHRDTEFPKSIDNNGDDNNGGGDNPSGDQPKDDGNNSPGRPPSTRDTKPRNERTPKTQSILHIIADGFMDRIDDLVDNTYLKQLKVKNMRSLTKAQRIELEKVKRGILSVLRPGDKVTKELIAERLDTAGEGAHCMENRFCGFVADFTASTKKTPTVKECRILTAWAWATTLPMLGLNLIG
jgi:hypothetical protein